MNRREFCQITSATVLLSSAALSAKNDEKHNVLSATASPDGKRPNILWICTDQQRYDTISCLGYNYLKTPNLDKLAKSGMIFTYAYCQSTICTPSRASFLTGYYPLTISTCKNGNAQWENGAPLITKILADNGYYCGLAGKLHLVSAMGRPEARPDDGYKEFYSSLAPLLREGEEESNDYFTWIKAQGYDPAKAYEEHGYFPTKLHQTTWCTDRAIDFITKDHKQPWLFSLNYFDPHPPLDPPQEYLDRINVNALPDIPFRDSDIDEYKKLKNVYFQSKCSPPAGEDAKIKFAKYLAQIELIDDNIGRLMNCLEKSGQADNTLVIFTSDHGNMIGHHGLSAKGCRFYDGLVRVPLIISWPGVVKPDVRNDAIVELVDIAPTLLEITGIAVDEAALPDARMHGRSLMPQLTGTTGSDQHREFAYSTYDKGLMNDESYATMIRTRKYKLINYHGSGYGQLFDMESDPGEFENLWDDPQYLKLKNELMVKSFDYTIMTLNTGAHYRARY